MELAAATAVPDALAQADPRPPTPDPVVPSSLPVIILTALFSLLPALILFWAYRRGYFRDLDAQSRIILEPRDMQLERPWESSVDRLTREVAHGPLVEPDPGEWGGAT